SDLPHGLLIEIVCVAKPYKYTDHAALPQVSMLLGRPVTPNEPSCRRDGKAAREKLGRMQRVCRGDRSRQFDPSTNSDRSRLFDQSSCCDVNRNATISVSLCSGVILQPFAASSIQLRTVSVTTVTFSSLSGMSLRLRPCK